MKGFRSYNNKPKNYQKDDDHEQHQPYEAEKNPGWEAKSKSYGAEKNPGWEAKSKSDAAEKNPGWKVNGAEKNPGWEAKDGQFLFKKKQYGTSPGLLKDMRYPKREESYFKLLLFEIVCYKTLFTSTGAVLSSILQLD